MLLHFPANFYIFKLSLSKSLCSAAFEWIIVLLLWSVYMEEWIQSVFWYSKVHFGIYYTQNCRSSEGRYLNRKYSSIISVGQLVSVHMNIQFIWCFFYFTLLNFIEPFVLFYCVLKLYFFFALSFFLGNSFILLSYITYFNILLWSMLLSWIFTILSLCILLYFIVISFSIVGTGFSEFMGFIYKNNPLT